MKSAQDRPRDHSLHLKPVTASRALVVVCVMAGVAWGFDDRREGWTLSGGIGAGAILWKNFSYHEDPDMVVKGKLQTNFTVVTDLSVGMGLNEHAEISWTTKSSWYSPGEALVVNSTVGPGFRVFFGDLPPSVFMTVSSGLAFRLYPVNLPWNKDFAAAGWGVSLGWGYEFKAHRSVELSAAYGVPARRQKVSMWQIEPYVWETSERYTLVSSFTDVQRGFTVGVTYNFVAY